MSALRGTLFIMKKVFTYIHITYILLFLICIEPIVNICWELLIPMSIIELILFHVQSKISQ